MPAFNEFPPEWPEDIVNYETSLHQTMVDMCLDNGVTAADYNIKYRELAKDKALVASKKGWDAASVVTDMAACRFGLLQYAILESQKELFEKLTLGPPSDRDVTYDQYRIRAEKAFETHLKGVSDVGQAAVTTTAMLLMTERHIVLPNLQ